MLISITITRNSFMLNSAEHEILNAHKYNNNKKFSLFSGSDKPVMLFFLLINVKMPTVVGILTCISRKISFSAELSIQIFNNLGPDCSVDTDEATHYTVQIQLF